MSNQQTEKPTKCDSGNDTDDDDEETLYYIVRFERAVYGGKHGEIIGMDTVDEDEFETLEEATEAYNDYDIEDVGELVYLDSMMSNNMGDEYQENIDCRGRLEPEEEDKKEE